MTIKFLTVSILGAAALTLSACGDKAQAPKLDTSKVEDMANTAKDKMDAMPVMETKAKAVLIYADWCGSCKVLDPKVQQVKAKFDGKGIEFVTLDYTAKDKAAFYAQAEAAGVSTAIMAAQDGNIKTGVLYLVSADGEKTYSKITKADAVTDITGKMMKALKGA